MKYPAYPSYKPSGVEWLGEVPEHWKTLSTKLSFKIQLGKMLQPEPFDEHDEEVPYLRAQHVHWEQVRVFDLPAMWASPADRAKYGVSDGDLLVCEGGDVGRAGLVSNAPLNTIIQNALHRVRPVSGNEQRFLKYVLEHVAAQKWFEILCNRATIAHFTGEKFGALPIPLPPPHEQRAIADYLEAQTAKLDTLVAKKRALIEKLKEKRSALISQTVTRGLPPDGAIAAGLDPHPRLKPSGVEWLGQVPEHWPTSKIKYVARIESGHTPSRSVDEYWIDCTIPWVSLNDSGYLRTHDYISDTAYKISELGLANSSARLLPSSAVVFSRDATVGLCAITTRPMAVSQHFVAYLCGLRLVPEYLLLSLKVMGQHLERLSLGATIATIGMDDVRALECPIPPVEEQRAIVAYITRETGKIDQMVAKVEAAIERLQEYRTALITAAVTGKIDLRGYRGGPNSSAQVAQTAKLGA